jgi:nucleotide-binding universal stress UspA family protein
MKKFLVPTDFSETARNAAIWAARMAESIPGAELVLFHAYGKMEIGEDGSPLATDAEAEKTLALTALLSLENELGRISSVHVTRLAHEGSLLPEVVKTIGQHGIDAVVMGITGASRLDQVLMGSNVLHLVDMNITPVFIVPPDAEYRKLDEIVIASDFKNVRENTPTETLRTLLDHFHAKLDVVNVDQEHYVEITEEFKKEKEAFLDMFKGYNIDFAFVRLYDFMDGINFFAEDRKAGLIVTLPKRHAFLGGLFKTSHTKKLAYHSHIPILALKS